MNNPFDTTNPWSNQTRGTGFNNQYNDPYRQTQVYTGFNNFQRPQSNIPGRLVNNLDEITPQEVPMDGSVSLFPQKTGFNNQAVTNIRKIDQQKEIHMEIRARP